MVSLEWQLEGIEGDGIVNKILVHDNSKYKKQQGGLCGCTEVRDPRT